MGPALLRNDSRQDKTEEVTASEVKGRATCLRLRARPRPEGEFIYGLASEGKERVPFRADQDSKRKQL